jgi:DNA invertase Pin-like site-specific DNA recombinase
VATLATAQDNLARKQIYIPALQPEAVVLRVAAYCRVSTDSEDQRNSFAAQQSYYNDYIRNHDSWQLAEIYADEGITGTSAAKRDDFLRMLSDCRKGRIDKILVKSISRFARNTKECLEYIRELKALGISVFFEEHNIDTKMVTSEMLTAVLASCAQAESESISKNMRWSYQKRMESGQFITCKAPFGYRLVDRQLVIEEQEAEIVRLIFRLFLSGWNTIEIANELNKRNVPQKEGKKGWYYTSIRCILRNEKYVGDARVQKKYSTETFPPVKKCNKGELPQYYITNSHPPILDRETFAQAQRLYESKRPETAGKAKQHHKFTQKIVCGCCGTLFRKTVVRENSYWVCNFHNKGGECAIKPVQETELIEAFIRLHFKLTHNSEILSYYLKSFYVIRNRQMLWGADIIELNKRISDIISQSHKLTAIQKSSNVDPDIFIAKSNQLAEQLRQAKQQKDRLQHQDDDGTIEATDQLLDTIQAGPAMLECFDEELFCELIDKIIVESNTRIRFRLKNGLELPEPIERTVR